MIKLTYKQLNNQHFNGALSALSNQSLPTKAAYRIAKYMEVIRKETDVAREMMQKLVKECVVIDESGKPKMDDSGEMVFLEGKKEEFNKKTEELLAIEFSIEQLPLSLDEISSAKLSARDMELLTCFVTELRLA